VAVVVVKGLVGVEVDMEEPKAEKWAEKWEETDVEKWVVDWKVGGMENGCTVHIQTLSLPNTENRSIVRSA
jgi:hypothetical protein